MTGGQAGLDAKPADRPEDAPPVSAAEELTPYEAAAAIERLAQRLPVEDRADAIGIACWLRAFPHSPLAARLTRRVAVDQPTPTEPSHGRAAEGCDAVWATGGEDE